MISLTEETDLGGDKNAKILLIHNLINKCQIKDTEKSQLIPKLHYRH